MKPLEFPVRNWQFTVVLFAMLAALGVSSWLAIPRGEDPPLEVPTFIVIAVYPGASPADLERLVVRDVEERLDALDNVDQIESRIQDGVATIQVEFDVGEDPDDRYEEVLREMNALRPELPAELVNFTVEKFTTLDVAIAQVALVSETAPYHDLDRLAERMEDRLGALPGVRKAERWGVPERQVDVALDLGRLARLDLPPSRVLQAIGGESADLPAGRVEAGARSFNVRTSGSYETPAQVAATVIAGAEGRLIRVRDVADVSWGYADSTYRARYNGKRAVFVTVTQQEGQNIQAVRDGVWSTLDAFEAELPAGITLERGFDQAHNVSHRLTRLGEDFAHRDRARAGHAASARLARGRHRHGLDPALAGDRAHPALLDRLHRQPALDRGRGDRARPPGGRLDRGGGEHHALPARGPLAVRGRDRGHAADRGRGAGATATLIFAFVPLLFLPGAPGQYIRSLPAAVIATVVASLFVSLTIIPWLASLVLPRHERREWQPRPPRVRASASTQTYAPVLDRALRVTRGVRWPAPHSWS